MFKTIITHAAVAVAAAGWAVYRLRPAGFSFYQAAKLVVAFGPRPTTPK